MSTTYTVLLNNGTVGTINSDSIDGQSASDFIGKVVRVKLQDENGMTIEDEGVLAEVIE